jgi:hypothetical protein
LRGGAQSDLELAGEKLGTAARELEPLMTDARTVIARVRDPKGTVGAALGDQGGSALAQLRARVSRLRDRMAQGSGPAASLAMTHVSLALARADSIRTLLNSPNRSFGRFRRDSTLGASVAGIRDELSTLQLRLAETDGTVGRFKTDSAITRAVALAQIEMKLLFDDIRRRPLHYIAF